MNFSAALTQFFALTVIYCRDSRVRGTGPVGNDAVGELLHFLSSVGARLAFSLTRLAISPSRFSSSFERADGRTGANVGTIQPEIKSAERIKRKIGPESICYMGARLRKSVIFLQSKSLAEY
jgi:hypothetical protein